MSPPSIYLAGPIGADDTPRSWRDAVKQTHPSIDWIDPMDWQEAWEQDPHAIWERELETVRETPLLVCNIGSKAPRTTGTHHEIREAVDHGHDVAIVPRGQVSQIYREIEPVRLFEDVTPAVHWLTRTSEVASDD